jgi:hypothetical protein
LSSPLTAPTGTEPSGRRYPRQREVTAQWQLFVPACFTSQRDLDTQPKPPLPPSKPVAPTEVANACLRTAAISLVPREVYPKARDGLLFGQASPPSGAQRVDANTACGYARAGRVGQGGLR